MAGATPVFCDVDLETNHMSIDSIKRMYSDKVKAIIYPHLFGNISDMQFVQKYCEEKNIKLIEDACQSFGANRKKLLCGDRSLSPCNLCNADGMVLGKNHAEVWNKIYNL